MLVLTGVSPLEKKLPLAGRSMIVSLQLYYIQCSLLTSVQRGVWYVLITFKFFVHLKKNCNYYSNRMQVILGIDFIIKFSFIISRSWCTLWYGADLCTHFNAQRKIVLSRSEPMTTGIQTLVYTTCIYKKGIIFEIEKPFQ